MKQTNIKYLNKFLIYLTFLIPISLVTGPFIPDLFVSIIAIIYVYILFVRNEIKIFYLRKKFNIYFFLYIFNSNINLFCRYF